MPQPLTVVCLHYLGGSALEFADVVKGLGNSYGVLAIDLPGFGNARDAGGYSVGSMVEAVASRIREADLGEWMLIGHSMGAKVAAVIARQAEEGAEGLRGLVGVVSLAGSPPGPEPMEESKREAMLGWFRGNDTSSRREAETYINENVQRPLTPSRKQLAVDDVLRAHPGAWRAWLQSGSREDLRREVGVLHAPTLILAGAGDQALGEAAQREYALPHYSNGRLQILEGTGHLLPLEQPEHVADLIHSHGQACARRV